MSKKRNPLLFLTDIIEAIERIESYTSLGKQQFFENIAFQDATFFRLQTIGEAVVGACLGERSLAPDGDAVRQLRWTGFPA